MNPVTIGAKLFDGSTAEIYEWGTDKVLKLFVAGCEKAADVEAHALKTAAASGIRVPHFYEEIDSGDRRGVVMERLNGPSLMSIAMEDATKHVSLGRILVDLQATLSRPFPPGTFKKRTQCLSQDIGVADLSRTVKGRLLERLKAVDTGEYLLCHFDLQLSNVLMCPEPVIIDWTEASLGPPICDYTRSLLLHGYPDHAGTRMETLVNAMLERYTMHLGVEQSELDLWIPIVAGARLAEGFKGHEEERLIALAERVS